jgi:hypothetical protein
MVKWQENKSDNPLPSSGEAKIALSIISTLYTFLCHCVNYLNYSEEWWWVGRPIKFPSGAGTFLLVTTPECYYYEFLLRGLNWLECDVGNSASSSVEAKNMYRFNSAHSMFLCAMLRKMVKYAYLWTHFKIPLPSFIWINISDSTSFIFLWLRTVNNSFEKS